MSQLLGALFFGVLTGSLYALAALGISIVYRASRVLNFALPGVGTVSAFLGYQLIVSGAGYLVAAAAILLSATLMSLAIYLLYVRLLKNATELSISVATLGVLLIMQGVVVSVWGTRPRALREAVAGSTEFGSVTIRYADFVALVVVAVIAASLLFWTAKTRSGAALRATSAGPLTSELLGINTTRNRLVAWSVSGFLAGMAGLFMFPILHLDSEVYVHFVLVGFAAVVMGGFLSAGGVLLSGLLIGVTISLLSTYVSGTLSATFTFLVILLVLILRPQGLFGIVDKPVNEPRIRLRSAGKLSSWLESVGRLGNASIPTTAPRSTAKQSRFWLRRTSGLVVGLVVVITLPFWVGLTMTSLLATAFATYIAVEGLNILAGDGGRLSLGHGGFMAIGAYTAAFASTNGGMSFAWCLLLGTAAGAIVGAVIGACASRLEGVYLIVLTLAFALTVPELVNTFSDYTGGSSGIPLMVPSAFFPGQSQYWILLAFAAAVAVAVHYLRVSKVGRGWRAVRDSAAGAASVGHNVFAVRVGAFTLSAALASLGGILSASTIGFVSPTTYGAFLSVFLVVAVVVGGLGGFVGSALGALIITLVPYYAGAGSSPQIVYGLVVLIVIAVAPHGVAGMLSVGGRIARGIFQSSTRRGDIGPVSGTELAKERVDA